MPTFYLQQREEGGRLIIDEKVPEGAHAVHDSIDAPDWLSAKQAFGFDLSRAQEWMLDERLSPHSL